MVAVRDTLEPSADGRPLSVGALTTPIETILGHQFARPELLREATTHRSAVHGRGRTRKGSNERMEFIGDRVLGLLIAEWLAERFPREQEGDLGRRLAVLVSQPVLAEVAEAIGLGETLAVAPGEAKAGVRRRATVLARPVLCRERATADRPDRSADPRTASRATQRARPPAAQQPCSQLCSARNPLGYWAPPPCRITRDVE